VTANSVFLSLMDNQKTFQRKTEPFLSPPGSEIYLCQAVRDLAETLSHNMHLGAGVQLVTGGAGSGKSTILNLLEEKFKTGSSTVVLLLRNPVFADLQQFLVTVAGTIKNTNAPAGFDDRTLQSAFNSLFLKLYQQEKKIVVLLIDNGGDLPDFCFKALQSFYDYHPDSRHFLQTVICGETSLQQKIRAAGLAGNHVFLTATPGPFNFQDVRKFIRFHLERSETQDDPAPVSFSIPAQWAVYRMTQGRPQQVIDLCQFLVMTLVIEKRQKADWFMTLRSAGLLLPERTAKLQIIRASFLSSLIICMLALGLWSVGTRRAEVPGMETLPLQATLPGLVEPQKKPPVGQIAGMQKSVPPEQTGEAPSLQGVARKEAAAPVPAAEWVKSLHPAAALPPPAGSPSSPEKQVPGSAGAVDADVEPAAEKVARAEEILSPVGGAPKASPGVESAQKMQPDQQAELPGQAVEPPASLGEITTAPGENFGDMVRRIYGPWSFNAKNVETVLATNPALQNPEKLRVGDKISFPAIPVILTPSAEEVWWARLNTFDSIESAYRFLRLHRKQPVPLLIVPARDENGRVFMNILLEEYFAEKISAEKTLQALPRVMASQAGVLHGLDRATFYYRTKEQE
jgi:type II secretory pathway predicted ATPase ExeA